MIYLICCLYAYLDGASDAFLYSRKGAHALPGNEHTWLVWRRITAFALCVAGAAYVALLGYWGFALIAAEGISTALAFSFVHNGSYYVMRAKINGKDVTAPGAFTHYWKMQSETDSSKYQFGYPRRRNMLYASLALLAIAFLLCITVIVSCSC